MYQQHDHHLGSCHPFSCNNHLWVQSSIPDFPPKMIEILQDEEGIIFGSKFQFWTRKDDSVFILEETHRCNIYPLRCSHDSSYFRWIRIGLIQTLLTQEGLGQTNTFQVEVTILGLF